MISITTFPFQSSHLKLLLIFYFQKGFTDWSEWSACSTTCEQGVQTRNRGPRDAGDVCEGPTSETRPCTGPRCECKSQLSLHISNK